MLQSLRRSLGRTSFQFGSQKEHTSIDCLEDWEYCRQISHSLKNKDLNSGLSLLFQSYFNGKVLDLQIYNSVFTAISQQNLPLSYSEVTYSVFREHFPPHLLMLNWMNKLSQSNDQPFIDKLKLDFQSLKQSFPKKSRRAEKANPVIREVDEGTRSRKSRLTRNSDSDPSKDVIEPPEIQFIDGDSITAEQLVKLRMQSDLRNALGQINNGVGNFGKINLFDVEIQFSQPEASSMDNQIYEEEGQDDEQMMSPEMGFMGLDISKIKIGRVEFLANPNEDKHDD